MMHISRSMDLWEMCISSLCSTDKLSFPSFSIFSFLLVASNIFFCFSNHLGAVLFFFLHLSLPSSVFRWQQGDSFSLRIWPIQLAFLSRILFRSVLSSPICSTTCSLVTFYILSSPFPSSNTFRSSTIFLVSRSLSQIKQ